METVASICRVEPAFAAVTVRAFEARDARPWDDFVASCPQATFFHRIGWRSIIEDVFRHRCHYLVAKRDGALCGVLPLAETRSRLFGHALTSLPFAVYGGPAAADAESEHALIDAAVDVARSLGVEYLELRNRSQKSCDWPRQDLYVTFRKKILRDIDANMLAIPRKQRAMVRKGVRHGLRSEVDAQVDRFFRLYADNMRRHGTPAFSRKYFQRLLDVFGPSCEITTVVDGRDKPVSSVLSFHFRGEILPYYAGDTVDARDLAANDFKYWEVLRRACETGMHTFDYGRSKRGTGSFDFKRNWGFDAEPLSYEFKLLKRETIPENNPLNPKYRAAIAVWRRLPIGVANVLGPHVVRSLG